MPKHSFLQGLLNQMGENQMGENQMVDVSDNVSVNVNNVSNNVYIGDTKHISNILDNIIFLGSQYSTRFDTISKRNIKVIISIGCNPLYHDDSIKIYKYDVEDNGDPTNVKIFFTQIIPQIHQIMNECVTNKTPFVVHCQAGMSRSASVIITWFMKYKKMSYDEAYIYVKERRPVISPNITFRDYMIQSF